MKSLLFNISLSLLLLLVASFSFSQNTDNIQFEKTTQKFKRVDEGHQINLTYIFTYAGKEEIGISNKEIDCSCTTINYHSSDLLIKPNSTNKITIKFDTSDKIGWQERKVIIQFMGNLSKISSSPYFEKTLTFKGMVKASKITKDAYKLNKRKK